MGENVNSSYIQLSPEERAILRRYQKHLWDIAKISFTERGLLNRMILDIGDELDLIDREMRVEKVGRG